MTRRPTADADRSLVDAEPAPFWLTDPAKPAPLSTLDGEHQCDLLVVGGGYCGLWTALPRADRNHGKRNLWLRTLDALGAGFDS